MSGDVVLRRRPLVRLVHGDCLDVLRDLRSRSVDSVVVDPPYGIAYQNKRAVHRREHIVNDRQPFVWWLWDAARVLKTGGALVCFCRWDVQEPFRLAIGLAGLKVRSQWVWDRVVHGMGDCKATLAPRHDVMWFSTKGRFAFPSGRPKSVIRDQSVPGAVRLHPTEKPQSLMRQIVRGVTPPRGVVLDPCMGSGATGEAVRDGFGFIGIEIERSYFQAAVTRLRRALNDRRANPAVRTGFDVSTS